MSNDLASAFRGLRNAWFHAKLHNRSHDRQWETPALLEKAFPPD
jgi:hypothetical protein